MLRRQAGFFGRRPEAVTGDRLVQYRDGAQLQPVSVQAVRAVRVPDPLIENAVPHAPRDSRVSVHSVLRRRTRGRPADGPEDETAVARQLAVPTVRVHRRRVR